MGRRVVRLAVAAAVFLATVAIVTTAAAATSLPGDGAAGGEPAAPPRLRSYGEQLALEAGSPAGELSGDLGTAESGVLPFQPYSNWYWPGNNFTEMSQRLVIHEHPDNGGRYYWAAQLAFDIGGSAGGYSGLQLGSSPNNTKIALFSIWGANGAGPGCTRFGGEGEGWTCRIDPFPWVKDRAYRLTTARDGSDGSGVWYKSSVVDTVTGQAAVIGRIRVPFGWGGLRIWTSWTEWFGGPLPSCRDLLPVTAGWENPTAQDGTVRTWWKSFSYGPADGTRSCPDSTTVVSDSSADVHDIRPK